MSEVFSSITPLSKKEEISVKQIYAYLLKSWGYDVKLTLKEIHEESKFIGSGDANQCNSNNFQSSGLTEETRKTYFLARKNLHYLEGAPNDTSLEETLNEKSSKTRSSKHFHHHVKVNKDITHHLLTKYNPEEMHSSFLNSLRNDTFDLNTMRYVVARDFHVENSLQMFIKCLDWRWNSHQVDDWVYAGDAEIYWKGKKKEFIEAFKLNQAYLRGHDKENRPICVIHVQKHLRSNCPDHDFEHFICLIIEWFRLGFKPKDGVSKGSILFDMTGFGMKNADLAAVKFLASMFEANYPECLGMIWVHNAPWIFNAVWKIIKGWLDPVVASKIRFTKGEKELGQYIDSKYIPKTLGGSDTYKNEYIPPSKETDDRKPKDEEFGKFVEERDELVAKFMQSTINWIQAKDAQESAFYLKERDGIQNTLSSNYKKIDPYIRTRGAFERNGQLKVE